MSEAARKRRYELTYNPVRLYFEEIKNGKVVSLKVYKVYKELVRIMDDPDSEWEYNSKKANHAIEFVENYCRHSKGKLGGTRLRLELWQKALVAATFGFVHKTTGLRKHRQVMLVVGRKNGKSTLAAAIGLYMQIADGELGAEVYTCATKKDQAKIIWLEAKRMVRKSPSLCRRIKTKVAELESEFNDSFFKYLGSDSDTLDGLNVHCGLFDEIHAWKTKALYDVVVDGTASREEPLIFITTTAGTIRESIFDQLYDEAEQIINGFGDENGYKDETFLPIIYELDKKEEWTDESCWEKANPGLGTIKNLANLKAKVKKAQNNPMLVKNLLCKDFNVRETESEAWLDFDVIDNKATFDVSKLKPKYGIAGADLSQTTDLTSAKVIFKVPSDEHIYVLSMYFLPEDLLERRVAEDKIPYNIWRDMGLLRTTPGNKVHHSHVTAWLKEVQEEYGIWIYLCGYDSWSATYWVEEMKNEFGASTMIPVIQGKKTLSLPMQNLAADFEKKKIVYNNNPIDKWCFTNTCVDIDKNDNIQPTKGRNKRKRIDGLASLLDAYTVMYNNLEEYEAVI